MSEIEESSGGTSSKPASAYVTHEQMAEVIELITRLAVASLDDAVDLDSILEVSRVLESRHV